MNATEFAATEMRLAWAAARDLSAALATGDDAAAFDAEDELQGMAMQTECAAVRKICRSALTRRVTATPEDCIILSIERSSER